MELNAVREKADLCPIDAGQEVIIVIGENLVKEKIESQLNFCLIINICSVVVRVRLWYDKSSKGRCINQTEKENCHENR